MDDSPDDDAPKAGRPGGRNEQEQSDSSTNSYTPNTVPWIQVDADLFRSEAVAGNATAVAVVAIIASSVRRTKTSLRDRYGNPIKLLPGQWILSQRTLAKAAGTTRAKIRIILTRLEKWQIISQQSSPHGTILTLLNCEYYRRRLEHYSPRNSQHLAQAQPTSNPHLALYVDCKTKETEETDKKKGALAAPKVAKPLPLEALRLADNLKDAIHARQPGNLQISPKRWEKTKAAWARDFRLAHEQDGRSYEALKRILDFSQADSFWASNICSGRKVREKFDQLESQSQSQSQSQTPVHREDPYERAERLRKRKGTV